MKQFTDKHQFSKDRDTVLKMFTDRDYFVNKYEMMGGRNIEVLEHEEDGSEFRITVSREVNQDAQLPGFLKKFVGETMTVVQTDCWNKENYTGWLEVDLEGVPADIRAEMHLTEEAEGGANNLEFQVKVSLPLIGGKIEDFLLKDIHKRMPDDVEKSRELLERY